MLLVCQSAPHYKCPLWSSYVLQTCRRGKGQRHAPYQDVFMLVFTSDGNLIVVLLLPLKRCILSFIWMLIEHFYVRWSGLCDLIGLEGLGCYAN